MLVLCSSALIPVMTTSHCLITANLPGSHFQLLDNIFGVSAKPIEMSLLLAILAAILVVLIINLVRDQLNFVSLIFRQIRQWLGSSQVFFYLALAFSRGIIHSKNF